jgi:hypothetical protein
MMYTLTIHTTDIRIVNFEVVISKQQQEHGTTTLF